MRCCCVRTNCEEVRSSSTGDQVVSAVKERKCDSSLRRKIASVAFTLIGALLLGIGMVLSFALLGSSAGLIGVGVLSALGAVCLSLGLYKLFLRMKRVSLDKAEQKMLEDQVELLRQENQELKAISVFH
ncbi:hypothetical protein FTN76_02660 [Chlamydia trachomatis]|uniref:Candidate inclusion membrane protein n=1 Tax=Chlamydia trachomatis serovar L2 (strain ATCC VR-902B / DSM 19102 / 434/Bu) TaxID=471472 RepID=A0A0H3MD72_CHLT2|nr:hypothetical protein [Chlamydia trachomatis]AEJ77495.1 incA family protein [Chlamydia trachomatis L2c]AGJ64577.1 putative inclusion membrane protein [Chlamydia trachomatis L2/434/Bu(i)]AGJ65518.1 putative inclusion membrane protein [Chlamydia trachomatis L2/434/Bu(f)]AGR93635.1 hypothetical protein CTRC69_01165 [Chlamydia trachomatis RC-F/69]AGR94558.1 hypothetical protein CTRC46_01150 [Chlamydia trachomatis RC-L2(s)/46]